MSVNALRGHLSEFGIIAAKGIGRVDELLDLVESYTTLPNAARASAKVLAHALEGLDKAIDDLEDEITNAQAQNEMTRLLYKVPGIGTGWPIGVRPIRSPFRLTRTPHSAASLMMVAALKGRPPNHRLPYRLSHRFGFRFRYEGDHDFRRGSTFLV
jgi:transposase